MGYMPQSALANPRIDTNNMGSCRIGNLGRFRVAELANCLRGGISSERGDS